LSIIGLAANTYTVTVTDGNNCTQSLSATLADPTPIVARIVVNGASSCGGATGSATASVQSGGITPFSYAWAGGVNTATNTTLAAGVHFVTVTDASGCVTTASCQISQNSSLAATADITTPIACFGNTNGVATATATGGTSPYTYEWDNTTMTAIAGGLSAGVYTVIATDALNCSVIAALTMTEPTALTAAISASANTTCSLNNGSATVTVLGGSPNAAGNYTYAWDNLAQAATTNTLAAGIHTVTVTDTQNCNTTTEVTITANAPLRVTVVADAAASCNLANGAATANGLSGTLPYTFVWDNNITTAINTTLTSGTHFVTMTDATGCTATSSIEVLNSSGLTLTLNTAVNPTCHRRCDGRATINDATGGTAPYSYLWTHNQDIALTQNGLCAGAYTVTVRDVLGCTSRLIVNITEPVPLAALANILSSASCGNNGVAVAVVTGGTIPYVYAWDTPPAFNGQTNTFLSPGQHTLTVTDANACTTIVPLLMPQIAGLRLNMIVNSNVTCFGQTDGIATVSVTSGASPYLFVWDNAETTAINPFLSGGTHTVTVTDGAGCVLSSTVSISAPSELLATVSGRTAGCNGTILGSAFAYANGGTAGYIFQWSHGPTGNVVAGLAPNIYTVYVTDSRGCAYNTSITIGDTPAPTIDAVDIVIPICNGDKTGNITLTATSGVPPLAYAWLTSPPLPSGTGNTFVLNSIGAGRYFVTITDAIGCTITTNVTMQEPPAIVATTTLTKPLCIGDSNGSITVNPTNGTAPYLYGVDGGLLGINNNLTLLAAGAHAVLVTDVNNCTWAKTVTIPQPLPIAVNVGNDITMPLGDSLSFSPVLNSFAVITYEWSLQAGLSCYTCRHPTAKPLATTTYTVTVTDTNGCTATDALTITVITEKNVYIPNAFTPNNDGINDNFTVYGGNAVDKIQLIRVFDRWGELVYQGAELPTTAKAWDGTFKGKAMNTAVFVYQVQVRFIDGEVQTFTGDVTLVN
jgi:gliding motility-associated-like protein